MDWSSKSVTRAYLDTLQLCNNHNRQYGTWRLQELGSNELVSALAAGMKAKLIVEVKSHVSLSTVALAAAARQSGGSVVCILPDSILDESKEVINNSGLIDRVDFRTEDPSKILPYYENIDFFLVDCKDENYSKWPNLVDVNATRSIVVATNLIGDKKGLRGCLRGKYGKLAITSRRHSLGSDMKITRICKNDDTNRRLLVRGDCSRKRKKSSWVAKFDEESGEEHIYRVPHADWFWS
ncbi:hypothetical protein RJT34_15663 [Clitoria ternatea]|uniref:S-adenosyl-L-methionine-dependent methyltransferase n=1 Tax=Clitoria ternatea TaxID=43366 RepID=A0AAN9J8T2_CLITE